MTCSWELEAWAQVVQSLRETRVALNGHVVVLQRLKAEPGALDRARYFISGLPVAECKC